MTPLATVSVIVPTSNRSDAVRTTIERLLAQDYPAERLEILIASGWVDATSAALDTLGQDTAVRVRVIRSDDPHPAARRNQALREAVGDIVVFVNEDVWVDPYLVSTHVAAHAQFAAPVAVLGYVEQTEPVTRTRHTRCHQPFTYDEIADQAGQSVPWQYCSAMNLSMPRRVMLDRRLTFHENWTEIGYEDLELGYRWTKAGYEIIYVPSAWGEHYHPHDAAVGDSEQTALGRGLRELEALVPKPDLQARYGILAADRPLRQRLPLMAQRALINSVTAPPLERALLRLPARSRIAAWGYRRLTLRHVRSGYQDALDAGSRPDPVRREDARGPRSGIPIPVEPDRPLVIA